MPKAFAGYQSIPYASQKRAFLVGEGSLNDLQISSWENNLCGLLCAQMVLKAFGNHPISISELLIKAEKIGAYDQKRGWIHDGLISLIKQHGVEGELRIVPNLDSLYALLANDELIIASVSPDYLYATRFNFLRKRTGHLVLIIGMSKSESGKYLLLINDPGSKQHEGGRAVSIDGEIFQRNFSGNVMIFKNLH